MSSQHHSGTGDNVGGDKIIIFNLNPFIKKLIFGVIISLLLYCGIVVIKSYLFSPYPKFKDNGKFKVLVLPFKELYSSGNSIDVGQILINELHKKAIIDSLPIDAHYYEGQLGKNFNLDSARVLQEVTKADMVIYGSYFSSSCDESIEGKICYNWIFDEDVPQIDSIIVEKINPSKYINVEFNHLTSNQDNYHSLDYLLYWISSISSYMGGNHLEAVKYSNYLIDSLNSEDIMTYKINIINNMLIKNYTNGVKRYKNSLAHATNPEDSITLHKWGFMCFMSLNQLQEGTEAYYRSLFTSIKFYGIHHPRTEEIFSIIPQTHIENLFSEFTNDDSFHWIRRSLFPNVLEGNYTQRIENGDTIPIFTQMFLVDPYADAILDYYDRIPRMMLKKGLLPTRAKKDKLSFLSFKYLGIASFEAGLTDLAFSCFYEAKQRAPTKDSLLHEMLFKDLAVIHYYVGRCYEKINNLKNAEIMYQSAYKIASSIYGNNDPITISLLSDINKFSSLTLDIPNICDAIKNSYLEDSIHVKKVLLRFYNIDCKAK